MADGFVELIDHANGFFTELSANNTRDWFQPRKAEYVERIRKPAELLAGLVAEDLARRTGRPHKPKVFRINRDIRFSRDKTPYNAHLHLLWTPADGSAGPGWFFGAAPEYLTVGMGAMDLKGDRLARWRGLVDRRGDEIKAAMAAAGAALSDWGPPPLKRVPAPYSQDHAHGDLLRRKAFAVACDLPGDWRARGLLPALGEAMGALLPLWSILDDGLG